MPATSLVVCLHRQRDFLERLLHETSGFFDDLVIVHDGPESAANDQVHTPDEIKETPPAIDYSKLSFDSTLPRVYDTPPIPAQHGSIHELTLSYGGRYFEGPRCFQQEPHWPFAVSRAKHDWILRLDADEFPSAELKEWLAHFRAKQDTDRAVSGYTCVWPVWNGKNAVTRSWPSGRIFLFHRQRVRFFGMAEQVSVLDVRFQSLPLLLHHQPQRKSHGLLNILNRQQGSRWRLVIAQSLLDLPQDLPQWRWNDNTWPPFWDRLRRNPIRAGAYSLLPNTARTLRDQWQTEHKLMPLIAVATPLHHSLIGLLLFQMRRRRGNVQSRTVN